MDVDMSSLTQNGSMFQNITLHGDTNISRFEGSVLNDSKRFPQFANKSHISLKDLSLRGKTAANQCTHEAFIDLQETILFVKCSPFERTSEIFGAGTRDGLSVFKITSVPGEEESTEFAYETVCTYH